MLASLSADPTLRGLADILSLAIEQGDAKAAEAISPALKRIAKGFQFVTISSDARLMAAGAQQVMAKMRAGAKATPGGTY